MKEIVKTTEETWESEMVIMMAQGYKIITINNELFWVIDNDNSH